MLLSFLSLGFHSSNSASDQAAFAPVGVECRSLELVRSFDDRSVVGNPCEIGYMVSDLAYSACHRARKRIPCAPSAAACLKIHSNGCRFKQTADPYSLVRLSAAARRRAREDTDQGDFEFEEPVAECRRRRARLLLVLRRDWNWAFPTVPSRPRHCIRILSSLLRLSEASLQRCVPHACAHYGCCHTGRSEWSITSSADARRLACDC